MLQIETRQRHQWRGWHAQLYAYFVLVQSASLIAAIGIVIMPLKAKSSAVKFADILTWNKVRPAQFIHFQRW